MIGSGNSCHPLNQSENKPRTKRAWPLEFSRASGSLPVLTLKSDWLLVTFLFLLIALISQLMQLRITFDCQLKSALFHVLESSAFHVSLKYFTVKGYSSNLKLLNHDNFSSLRQTGHLTIIFERLRKYREISDFSLSAYNVELSVKVNSGLCCI